MDCYLTGFDGRIWWDVSKAEQYFGFKSRTPFEEGLHRTIDWYQSNVAMPWAEVAVAGGRE